MSKFGFLVYLDFYRILRRTLLHNRQAPGRDFHEHFSLAPARSERTPEHFKYFDYFELEN